MNLACVIPQDLSITASPEFVGLTLSSLTAKHVLYAGPSKEIKGEAGFEYDEGTDTLSVVNISAGAIVAPHSTLTGLDLASAGHTGDVNGVVFANGAGAVGTSTAFTWDGDILSATAGTTNGPFQLSFLGNGTSLDSFTWDGDTLEVRAQVGRAYFKVGPTDTNATQQGRFDVFGLNDVGNGYYQKFVAGVDAGTSSTGRCFFRSISDDGGGSGRDLLPFEFYVGSLRHQLELGVLGGVSFQTGEVAVSSGNVSIQNGNYLEVRSVGSPSVPYTLYKMDRVEHYGAGPYYFILTGGASADYFQFNDDILMQGDREIFFRNTNQYIHSPGLERLCAHANSFEVSDGNIRKIQTVTGAGASPDLLLTGIEYTVLLDGNANTCLVNLDAVPVEGQIYNFKCVDATNACTVGRNGKTIDRVASDFVLSLDECVSMQADSGGNWEIVV